MDIEYNESIWSLEPEKAVKDIEQLLIGEQIFYPESDYSHGVIKFTRQGYECWEIPMYGDQEVLFSVEDFPEEAFKVVAS